MLLTGILFLSSILYHEAIPSLVDRFRLDPALIPNPSAQPVFGFSFSYKTTIFIQRRMGSFFKIGRLKFPLQSLLGGCDNRLGGFLVFDVRYFRCRAGFDKNGNPIHRAKIFFTFKKESRNDHHLLFRLSDTKWEGSDQAVFKIKPSARLY